MNRGGLVAYVEARIESDIALGRCHPSGRFASEAEMARRYGVCRGTIREALRRLAARGLVVQRPGRKTRVVALDESLTLENLGVALHDARSPDARWHLDGYLSLKRQVLVELLVDCCAKASPMALGQVKDACFKLQDAARWGSGAWCAQMEFELLRVAARVAERPGYMLLVQSLHRAFLGGAVQLQPLMGGALLREWAWCALEALYERDARTLQHELPALLKVCDDRVLEAFAPVRQEPVSSEAAGPQEAPPGAPASASAPCGAPKARPDVAERDLGQRVPAAEKIGVLPPPTVPGPILNEPVGHGTGADEQAAASESLSDSRMESPHETGGRLDGWIARLWRFMVHALGPSGSCSQPWGFSARAPPPRTADGRTPSAPARPGGCARCPHAGPAPGLLETPCAPASSAA
ncbi:GntR family transcriptional regulator [Corallococcus sp. NCSPR001]|nr:GntR family transcriptional regulator [Corallococcus sp. NCSPR001]MBN9682264.1 GntR family transcriptional regulator [Corallococcus sp. NCSPR001]WAS86180.1 GntR family transcriptional regulator [Corallococcus sp. NCRR]